MKKIINGKRYDTNTAQKMGAFYHLDRRDFHYFWETLYRKTTGEYFLYGEGGPASKYAETVGQNEWSGGEKIMPLTVEAAQKWAEEHLTADQYEDIFGDPGEGEKKTVTFSLSEGTAEKIRRNAAAAGVTMSEYVTLLVENDRVGGGD